MIHRSARVDARNNSSKVASRGNSNSKETSSSLQRRKHTFWASFLGSLVSCYLAAVALLPNNDPFSFASSENPLPGGFDMGSGWKVLSSSETLTGHSRQNQTVLLYIDGEISVQEEKGATGSLQSLVNQFGSQSLQWEVIRQANKQYKTLENGRQTLPCVWITKKEQSPGSNPSGSHSHSNCIQLAPLVTATSDDPSKPLLGWRLQKHVSSKPDRHNSNSAMVINATSCLCLPRQVGPRPDFWQRGMNFNRVGLWIQAASIRSYVWNMALFPESESSSSLEKWLFNSIDKIGASALPEGRNSSEFVVTKSLEDYKPVPYFRDLLASVFTFVVLEEDWAISSLQNVGRKQRNSKNQKRSTGQRRSTFWKQLHEIILTGSIPIVIMMGLPKTPMDCNHEWFFDSTSPILVVSNQIDQIESLLNTLWKELPAKWNERQEEFREWYQMMMIKRAIQVEDWIFETSRSTKVPLFEQRIKWAKEHWQASVPNFLQQRRYDPKPLCLTPPFYGRTNNKVIEIGKLLKLSHKEGKHRALALDRRWSKWYRPQFDERPDVLLDYVPHGECEKTFTAREAFEIPDWDLSHLINLLPRHDYRERAEKILNTWQHGNNYISVHRRDLEGSCHVHAKCSDVELETSICLKKRDPTEVCSVALRLQACDMEFNMVPNPEGLPIVLFTDGQVPAKDMTFPHMFNTTDFFVEMWLMVKSKTHWGNPRSTVDAVVSSWREGRGMEPRECYPS